MEEKDMIGLLNDKDYRYLESIVNLVQTSGYYGDLIMESTVGRRFMVELMFQQTLVESTGSLKDSVKDVVAKVLKPIKSIVKKEKVEKEASEVVNIAANKDLQDKDKNKDGTLNRLITSIRTFFKKIGGKLSDAYSKIYDFCKKYKLHYVAIAAGLILIVIAIFKREWIKNALTFIKNMINKGVEGVKKAVTFVLNKVKGVKPETSEAVTESVTKYAAFWDNSDFNYIIENFLISEEEGQPNKEGVIKTIIAKL